MFSKKVDWIIISVSYIFVNFLYFYTGGKFHFDHIKYFWQFLDVRYLKNDLLRGVFYLHSQPPLFNFITGVLIKNPFLKPQTFAMILFLILGYFSLILFYKIMVMLDIDNKLSLFFSLIFFFNPSFLMFETFYFYTLPVIFLLILSLYFLIRYFKEKNIRHFTLFLFSLLVLSLIRSIFHLLFFLMLFFIFFYLKKEERRKVYKRIAIVTFILLLFYLKNFILFDTFSLSSWFGMNFAKVFSFYMDKKEKKKLLTGNLEDVFYIIPPFSFPKMYPQRYLAIPEKYRNIPELSKSYKRIGDVFISNYNYYPYIRISKIYLKKYLKALEVVPMSYMRGVLKSFEFYLIPAYHIYLIKKDSTFLKRLIFTFNYLLLRFWNSEDKKKYTLSEKKLAFYTKFAFYPLFAIFVLLTFPLFIFNLRVERTFWKRIVYIFIFFTIIYVMYVGMFFECGENNRFRFTTHAYYLIVWAIFIKNLNSILKSVSKKN